MLLQGDLSSLSPLSRLSPCGGRDQLAVFSDGSYIAYDMEEDIPMAKQSIFPFVLGREHWQQLYKKFLQLKFEFFRAMEYRAWVTRELCEEVCRG